MKMNVLTMHGPLNVKFISEISGRTLHQMLYIIYKVITHFV